MDGQIPQSVLDKLIEKLAAIEHERWSHWQRYMHSKSERMPDGSLVLSFELVEQWERQIATPYGALSESEKDSDRDQVRRYLPVILDMFGIVINISE
jgi:hypothetical protein